MTTRDVHDRHMSHELDGDLDAILSDYAQMRSSLLVTRLHALLDEPRPRPQRPEPVVLRHVEDCPGPAAVPRASPNASTLATSTVPLLLQPRGRRTRPNGFLLGLSRRPAHPIERAAVATMRTGLRLARESGGKTARAGVKSARRLRAEASRRSSPPLPLCRGAHDKPR